MVCIVYGLWFVVHGMYCMVCGTWYVLYGVWYMVCRIAEEGLRFWNGCGLWSMESKEYGVWSMEYGEYGVWRVWSTEYGVWCMEYGGTIYTVDWYTPLQ